MVRSISEGLLIAGRKLTQKGDVDRAEECFNRGMTVIGRNKKYLMEIAEFCYSQGNFDFAKSILEKFSPSEQRSEEYENLDLLLQSQEYSDGQFVDHGRKLIKEGRANYNTFVMTIEKLRKLNLNRALDDVMYEATRKYPDMRGEFEKIATQELEKIAA